ncbi:hypothetical protein EDB19DRAFT_1903684 [Suillus lakei]|nr:hypothetical protein EDB19DRAFT_1903684 [Suillus lakei]
MEQDKDKDPIYNCRWGPAPTGEEPLQHNTLVTSGDEDDDTVYDCGWGQEYTPAGEQPIQQDTLAISSNKDLDPVYDCRWGWGGPAGCDDPILVSGDEDEEPVYDCGWGAPPKGEVIIVSGDEDSGPVYDCRWGRGSTPAGEQPTGDVIDLTRDNSPSNDLAVSLSEDEGLSDTGEAEREHCWRNQRLWTISNDMTDEHMHAIINNAIHGLTNSRPPYEILWEHRHTLSGFAEAQNQVTVVGVDTCQLHHLIQLQHRLLKSIDHVIGSLENPEQ